VASSTEGGFTVWLTGLSGAGKTTIGHAVAAELERRGLHVEVLDGDIVRTHLSKGLGYSHEDRDTNIERIGWVASRLTRHGAAVVVAAISPYDATRKTVRALVEEQGPFVEVWVKASVEECARRDAKGLYAKAFAGEITQFTGVDDPYEEPDDAEVVADTVALTPDESVALVMAELERLGLAPVAEPAAGCSSVAELVAERDERLARLAFDVGELFRRQVAAPAPRRRVVRLGERGRHEGRLDSESRRDGCGSSGRVRDELLVANLDRALWHGSRGRHVAAPCPCDACRVGDRGELGFAARLDPEPGVGAERQARVVGAGPFRTEPAALEQRRRDVAPVADHVHGERLRVRAERRVQDKARLRRLLDSAQPAGEPERADALEHPPEPRRGDLVRNAQELRDRRLPGLHLVEIDEPGEQAERTAREGRAGARRADDEDDALLGAEPAAPARDAQCAPSVERGARHGVS
jgi:adenylyl-sulfate kinase